MIELFTILGCGVMGCWLLASGLADGIQRLRSRRRARKAVAAAQWDPPAIIHTEIPRRRL